MKNRANEENREMVLNNTVQIKHHADELKQAVKEAKDIPAWVVAKVYEATTSMSNATHYLDGTNKMKSGGMVFSKKDLLFRFPPKEYTKEVSENGNITFTNKSKKKNKFTFREKSKNQFVLKRDGLTWTWRMENGGLVERRYRILSPDGFDIAFDKTYTIDEISSAFEEFKNRYKAQGYYSTSNRDRIDLDDLEDYCTIVEYDESEEEFGKGGGVGKIIGTLKSGKPIYSKTFTDNDSGQIDIKDPNSTGPKHIEKYAKTLPNGNHGIQVATRGGRKRYLVIKKDNEIEIQPVSKSIYDKATGVKSFTAYSGVSDIEFPGRPNSIWSKMAKGGGVDDLKKGDSVSWITRERGKGVIKNKGVYLKDAPDVENTKGWIYVENKDGKRKIHKSWIIENNKMATGGGVGSKLKETAITAKNRLKSAYLRTKRYFQNMDKPKYKVIEKGDKHYNEIGIAINGIEKDKKGKSFVTLTFKKGVNTYGIDEVEKIYETGGSMMTRGGNTKTGYINDRDSMYHGKNCFVCSHNGPEMMVEIMLKGKMKKIPLSAEKFEPIKTYEEGGAVKIVNKNIKFDRDRYKGIFGDFDKDGVVNIDDAYPTNKKRKNTVEPIELAPIIQKLITLKNKLDNSMYSTVDELREKSPKTANIYARTKTPYSIIKKLIDKRLLDEKKGLTDLIGTTIAVDTYAELVDLKKKIENGLLGTVVSVDDFYTNPNAGYMAYHYIIKTDEGFLVEVQLKTKRMKSLNEISHEFYKKGNLDAENFLELTKLTHFADMGDEEYVKKYNYLMKRKSLLRMLLTGEKKINLKSEKLIG